MTVIKTQAFNTLNRRRRKAIKMAMKKHLRDVVGFTKKEMPKGWLKRHIMDTRFYQQAYTIPLVAVEKAV